MTDWKNHWERFPKYVGETEFLEQVGKTVHGQSISNAQFRRIIFEISERLELQETDLVLDLCCGNGLITFEIAKASQIVIGVDYSRPLINIARKYHNPENVRYVRSPVLDLSPEAIRDYDPFTKVYMYEALQHFQEEDLLKLLRFILEISANEVTILFGSVPDRSSLWQFYNSPRRRLDYFSRKLQGREAIGSWWKKDFILETCHGMGLQCEFFEQHKMLHTAHYRFDFRVTRCV